MAPVVGLLLLCALSAGLQSTTAAGTRKLQQSNGPANTYGNAASATTDLVNDPAGRAHLLVSAQVLQLVDDWAVQCTSKMRGYKRPQEH